MPTEAPQTPAAPEMMGDGTPYRRAAVEHLAQRDAGTSAPAFGDPRLPRLALALACLLLLAVALALLVRVPTSVTYQAFVVDAGARAGDGRAALILITQDGDRRLRAGAATQVLIPSGGGATTVRDVRTGVTAPEVRAALGHPAPSTGRTFTVAALEPLPAPVLTAVPTGSLPATVRTGSVSVAAFVWRGVQPQRSVAGAGGRS